MQHLSFGQGDLAGGHVVVERRAGGLCGGPHTGLFIEVAQPGLQIGPAGTVADDRPCSLPGHQLRRRAHHGRVGAHRLLRPRCRQKIGLQQQGFPRAGEAPHPAHPFNQFRCFFLRLRIIRTGGHKNPALHAYSSIPGTAEDQYSLICVENQPGQGASAFPGGTHAIPDGCGNAPASG